jgi:hypothetical protein
MPADHGRWREVDLSAHRSSEDLAAEADAEDRDLGLDRPPGEVDLPADPGRLKVGGGVLRAQNAEPAAPVEARRDLVAVVDPQDPIGDRAPSEPRAEQARWRLGLVLEQPGLCSIVIHNKLNFRFGLLGSYARRR